MDPRVEWRALPLPCFLKRPSGEQRGIEKSNLLSSVTVPDVLDVGGRRRVEWVKVVSLAKDADVLVCNLFALPPVYHLSERLVIPWFCCSPSLVPYAAPARFVKGVDILQPKLIYPSLAKCLISFDVSIVVAYFISSPLTVSFHSSVCSRLT